MRRPAATAPVGTLIWHHTEFGRRTACGRFRVVAEDGDWALLDAEWNPLGKAGSIVAAQQLAERFATPADRRISA